MIFATQPDVTNTETTVALGDEMVVAFTKIGELSFFHIDNCKADNNVAADAEDFSEVQLIQDGCLVDKTSEPLMTIDPKLSEDGKTFTFNQFGFVVADSDPIALTFNMLCTLKFGEAPTADECAATGSTGTSRSNQPRQFRQEPSTPTESATVLLDYGVTAGEGDFNIENGIAVAADGRDPTYEPGHVANKLTDTGDAGEHNGARSVQIGFLLAAAVNVL